MNRRGFFGLLAGSALAVLAETTRLGRVSLEVAEMAGQRVWFVRNVDELRQAMKANGPRTLILGSGEYVMRPEDQIEITSDCTLIAQQVSISCGSAYIAGQS